MCKLVEGVEVGRFEALPLTPPRELGVASEQRRLPRPARPRQYDVAPGRSRSVERLLELREVGLASVEAPRMSPERRDERVRFHRCPSFYRRAVGKYMRTAVVM